MATAPQIDRIRSIPVSDRQISLWWLGQSGFLMRGANLTLLIDAYLASGHDRLVPPAFSPEQAVGLDLIVATHDHIDHLDPESFPALAEASPNAKIVVPLPIVQRVIDLGIDPDRIVGAQPAQPLTFGGLTVHPVPAVHGVNVSDAYTFGQEISDGLYRYLGYVFDFGGVAVFHAGDTIAFGELPQLLRDLRVDVALLPINGRDRFREAKNLVGNMDERDAAHVAAAAGVDLLIPVHYDMFAGNRGYPAHLVQFVGSTYPELSVLVPTRQRPFVYTSAVREGGAATEGIS